MNRTSLLWFGSLALLLLFAAWWFTVMTASAGPLTGLTPAVVSAITMIAGLILSWVGWQKEISGLFVLASSMMGIGLIGLAQWFSAAAPPGRAAWLLLPAFSGAGILIENRLGFGWRFSDRQGVMLIFLSLAFFMAALLWMTHSSGAGLTQRVFDTTGNSTQVGPIRFQGFDFPTNH